MAYPMAVPPWIQSADPAGQYATGLQIGARIGAQQAAQQYQQQRMLMEQQRAELDRQVETTKLNLVVGEAARKYGAMDKFQRAVQGGMSPENALMQFGPEMGESINETLRTKAMAQSRNFGQQLRIAQLLASLQNAERQKQSAEDLQRHRKVLEQQAAERQQQAQANAQNLSASRMGRDQSLIKARQALRDAQAKLARLKSTKPSRIPFMGPTSDQLKADTAAEEQKIKLLEDQIKQIEARYMTKPAAVASVPAESGQVLDEEPDSEAQMPWDSAGDNTMPDAQSQAADQEWQQAGGFKIRKVQ